MSLRERERERERERIRDGNGEKERECVCVCTSKRRNCFGPSLTSLYGMVQKSSNAIKFRNINLHAIPFK